MENSAKKDPERLHGGGVILFGDFRLVPATRTLTRNGSRIHLGARALDILIALIERAGQIVSKEELFSKVWPNTFLEESNLRVHIAALRKALGDGQSNARLIMSVPRRGYVFVAAVNRTPADENIDNSKKLDESSSRNYVPPPLVRTIGREEEANEL